MYIIQDESFGPREPTVIERHTDQVIVYEGIYSKQVEVEEKVMETHWFASKGYHYTIREYSEVQDQNIVNAEDLAKVNAYETAIQLITELRPE